MCNKKHNNILFVGIHLYVKGILGFGSIFCEMKLNVYFQVLLCISEARLKIRIDILQPNLNKQA